MVKLTFDVQEVEQGKPGADLIKYIAELINLGFIDYFEFGKWSTSTSGNVEISVKDEHFKNLAHILCKYHATVKPEVED